MLGLQKMDGVTGSLIVRGPRDPSLRRYFWDLQQHVIVVQDWLHQYTAERLPGPRSGPRRGQLPDSLLINGRGRFIVS
jgi:FtsP/CotA-like multicopper oxidase with cupredoxin domain